MSAIKTRFKISAPKREALFISLYQKAFPAVASYVSKMGGTYEEAKDIFQDALVIYYEKLQTGVLALQGGEAAYILGIAKHLWSKRFRALAQNTAFEKAERNWSSAFAAEEMPSTQKLLYFLETAGKKCMEILQAFYYEQLPLTEVANLFGYKGVRSATVQKYKCLEKVRDKIKEKSLHYEDFLE